MLLFRIQHHTVIYRWHNYSSLTQLFGVSIKRSLYINTPVVCVIKLIYLPKNTYGSLYPARPYRRRAQTIMPSRLFRLPEHVRPSEGPIHSVLVEKIGRRDQAKLQDFGYIKILQTQPTAPMIIATKNITVRSPAKEKIPNDPSYYKHFVQGAPARLTNSIHKPLGLVNGQSCFYHSLVPHKRVLGHASENPNPT